MNKFVKGAATALAITFAGAAGGIAGGTAMLQGYSLVAHGEIDSSGATESPRKIAISFAGIIGGAFAGYGVGAVMNRRRNAKDKCSPPTMVP
jgi:hypothetical protein